MEEKPENMKEVKGDKEKKEEKENEDGKEEEKEEEDWNNKAMAVKFEDNLG